MRTTDDLVGGAASSVVPFVAIATEVTRFTRRIAAVIRNRATADAIGQMNIRRTATIIPRGDYNAQLLRKS
jgi:hypothetical protein